MQRVGYELLVSLNPFRAQSPGALLKHVGTAGGVPAPSSDPAGRSRWNQSRPGTERAQGHGASKWGLGFRVQGSG